MNYSDFDDEKGRFSDRFYLSINPTFDTTSKLEFNIPPAGAFIQLNHSVLKFEFWVFRIIMMIHFYPNSMIGNPLSV